MSGKKTLSALVVNLNQAEKEILAGIIQEADIARQLGSKKSFRAVFREQGAKQKGKVKRLCSILAKEKTDSEKALDVFHQTLKGVA